MNSFITLNMPVQQNNCIKIECNKLVSEKTPYFFSANNNSKKKIEKRKAISKNSNKI